MLCFVLPARTGLDPATAKIRESRCKRIPVFERVTPVVLRCRLGLRKKTTLWALTVVCHSVYSIRSHIILLLYSFIIYSRSAVFTTYKQYPFPSARLLPPPPAPPPFPSPSRPFIPLSSSPPTAHTTATVRTQPSSLRLHTTTTQQLVTTKRRNSAENKWTLLFGRPAATISTFFHLLPGGITHPPRIITSSL